MENEHFENCKATPYCPPHATCSRLKVPKILSHATSLRALSFGGLRTWMEGLRPWTSQAATSSSICRPISTKEQIHNHIPLTGLMPAVPKHRATTEGGPRQYIQFIFQHEVTKHLNASCAPNSSTLCNEQLQSFIRLKSFSQYVPEHGAVS